MIICLSDFAETKVETPKDKARASLLAALGRKDPKDITSALKNFEKIMKTTDKTKEDEELLKVANAEKQELEKSSRMASFPRKHFYPLLKQKSQIRARSF